MHTKSNYLCFWILFNICHQLLLSVTAGDGDRDHDQEQDDHGEHHDQGEDEEEDDTGRVWSIL